MQQMHDERYLSKVFRQHVTLSKYNELRRDQFQIVITDYSLKYFMKCFEIIYNRENRNKDKGNICDTMP